MDDPRLGANKTDHRILPKGHSSATDPVPLGSGPRAHPEMRARLAHTSLLMHLCAEAGATGYTAFPWQHAHTRHRRQHELQQRFIVARDVRVKPSCVPPVGIDRAAACFLREPHYNAPSWQRTDSAQKALSGTDPVPLRRGALGRATGCEFDRPIRDR